MWGKVWSTSKKHYFHYFEFCNETCRPKTNSTEGMLEPEGMAVRMVMSIRMVMSSLVVEIPPEQEGWDECVEWKEESMFNFPQGSCSCQCDSTCHLNFTLAFVLPSFSSNPSLYLHTASLNEPRCFSKSTKI